MKIAVVRLRSRIKYEKPLEHILDSFYSLLAPYIKAHAEHEWAYYGITFDGSTPHYDPEVLRDADVFVVPSEAEFTYHVPGLLHTLDVKRANERVRALSPFIEGKRIVVLRSDRRDDQELFREYTWPGVSFEYREIDEDDFSPNVHAMKLHFLRDAMGAQAAHASWGGHKNYDVAYWGTDKRKAVGGGESGDQRHEVLKALDRDWRIHPLWIGLLRGPRTRHIKFSPMRELAPHLLGARTTICFNWYDTRALTARYFEAVGCGIIPLVWGEYDSTNKLGVAQIQRVSTPWQARQTVHQLSSHHALASLLFSEVERGLLDRVQTPEEYADCFAYLLDSALA